MNIRELNKRSESFTQTILEKAKMLKEQEEIEEVTTSSTDTTQTFDFGEIPQKKRLPQR